MRINKYLADKQYASRREADELIKLGKVFINGRKAVLGDQVTETDKIEVKNAGEDKKKVYYYAYNKPVGVVTHSAQADEIDIERAIKGQAPVRLFPIGRLDKDSHGLLILTNDGRITGKLLDPEEEHDKQYVVEVNRKMDSGIVGKLERGVLIEDGNGNRFKTKPCVVTPLTDKRFDITLTEGKKHQIRKMCESVGFQVTDLKRVRIMNIKLGHMQENTIRKIKGEELDEFLQDLGVRDIRAL